MQTQREYLSGLNPPLAKPGSRGRFSLAAQSALADARAQGTVFADGKGVVVSTGDDPFPNTDLVPRVYPKLRERPVVRDIKAIQGYTPEGHLVSSGICFKCASHVSRCNCRLGIAASPIVARWTDDHAQYGAPIDRSF